MKDILELSRNRMIGLAPKAIVVAEAPWISRLPEASRENMPAIEFLPLPRDAEVPTSRLADAEVLILEVDATDTATLDRVAAVRRANPSIAIIAAVANADLQLMRILLRHGVSDAVALPFEMEELTAEIYNIGARLAAPRIDSLSPIFAVAGSLARSGSTSLLLHLAAAIVEQSDRSLRCCLIDLDVQRGQLETQAGAENARSIVDLMEAEHRLDADMVRNVAAKVREGIYLISAPRDIAPMDKVQIDQVLRILTLARSQFDLVLIDLPPTWTDWSLSIAAESDRLLLITEQTLPHLRQARRCLDMFREVGMRPDQINLIVNKAMTGRFVNISIQDVADTLQTEVLAAVREDKGDLAKAIDEGRLVTEISRRSPFAADVASLAETLLPAIVRGNAK